MPSPLPPKLVLILWKSRLLPPSCLPDHGLWKIQIPAEQKNSGCKKSQTVIQIKEIRLRPKTEEHDLEVKIKHIKKFLEQNNKVKITMMFRGREIAYTDLGRKVMEDLKNALADVCVIEQQPRLEGRSMIMIIVTEKIIPGGRSIGKSVIPGSSEFNMPEPKEGSIFLRRGDGMPKIKTHRGAAKRFSLTGTGRVKRARPLPVIF